LAVLKKNYIFATFCKQLLNEQRIRKCMCLAVVMWWRDGLSVEGMVLPALV